MCLILANLYVPLTCIEKVNLSMSLHFRKACNDPRIGTLWKAKKTVRELQNWHATCSTYISGKSQFNLFPKENNHFLPVTDEDEMN